MLVHYANEEDAAYVAANLRKADRDEIEAGSGMTPAEVLAKGLDISSICFVVMGHAGNPVAIYGVVTDQTDETGRTGIVWLLGTDMDSADRRAFARRAKEELDFLHAFYPRLHNLVYGRNDAHLRFVSWLGFQVIDDGVGDFRYFCKESFSV
jgi:hypothetical protein